MISKDNLKEQFEQYISDAYKSTDFIGTLIKHPFFQYLTTNYDELDDKLKTFVDKTFDSLTEIAKNNIENMPDCIEKRQAKRSIKKMSGEHFNIEFYIKELEKRNSKNIKIFDDIKDIFIRQMQNIIDLLSDVSEHSQKGIASFAKISLLYFCIDELLVAFHLTQHSYINQAYTHIRTVSEALDKIELFDQQPQWADLWSSQDPKDKMKILNELSPKSVRQKLGREKYDPLYSFFSELGPHGTFKGVQSRSGMRLQPSPSGKPLIRFWIGGCPFEHNIIWISTFLLYTISNVITKVMLIFRQYLNEKEIELMFKEFIVDYKNYLIKHFIPWAQKEGYETESFSQYINELEAQFNT